MVQTRSGRQTRQNSSRLSTGVLLLVSSLVAAVGLSAAYVAFESFETKAHSIFQRSTYTFGGAKGQATEYWNQVPSWEKMKNYASNTQVLPEPSLWDHAKSFVTRKPVRQVQAEAAYASGKQAAADYADSAKQAAQDSKKAASDYADSAKDTAYTLSDKVRSTLFGMKTAAQKEAARQRRLAVEAQWRAEYESQQGVLQAEAHPGRPPQAAVNAALRCGRRCRLAGLRPLRQRCI